MSLVLDHVCTEGLINLGFYQLQDVVLYAHIVYLWSCRTVAPILTTKESGLKWQNLKVSLFLCHLKLSNMAVDNSPNAVLNGKKPAWIAHFHLPCLTIGEYSSSLDNCWTINPQALEHARKELVILRTALHLASSIFEEGPINGLIVEANWDTVVFATLVLENLSFKRRS